MKEHTCVESRTCCCSIVELEPDEDCPLHGCPWPPRCEICGRFMPRREQFDPEQERVNHEEHNRMLMEANE